MSVHHLFAKFDDQEWKQLQALKEPGKTWSRILLELAAQKQARTR